MVFKEYHPAVNFIYFVCVIGCAMTLMHPACLAISFIAPMLYCFCMEGRKVLRVFLYILPVVIITALLNPAFNHRGITILIYLPGGNPLTLESIFYGLAAAVMFSGVIIWFRVYQKVMTADKFVYLFGKTVPSLSLLFSMTLRFVPVLADKWREIRQSRIELFGEVNTLTQKIKRSVETLSIIITWSLENAIDVSDSMKARGYGLSGRTSFWMFRIEKRDIVVITAVIVLTLIILCVVLFGKLDAVYYPAIKMIGAWWIYIVYAVLCNIPLVLQIIEEIKWKHIK